MKKVLFLLLALIAFAAIPALAVTDAVLFMQYDTTISAGSTFDSLLAANDSSTLCAATPRFKQGYTYYLQLGRLAGASKDTCNLTVVADAYDAEGAIVGRAWGSDTSADRSEQVLLNIPIGSLKTGVFGVKYVLKLMNVSTGTTAAKLNLGTIRVVKARPVNVTD
jgi:hypothetical protein